MYTVSFPILDEMRTCYQDQEHLLSLPPSLSLSHTHIAAFLSKNRNHF